MEQAIRKYPIGIQTFEEIIKGRYAYVDKTDLIYKLVQSGKYYFLSRPRRFGKSLLITTLQAYFEGKKDLFRGLAIESLEKEWKQYPVFHLDFSGETYNTPQKVEERIESYLREWEGKYGQTPNDKNIGNRMRDLLQRASERTGEKAVILIDEYDKPLTDAIGKTELQDQNRAILQGLYGVLKNADACIQFAMLTGVTRYGKLGIFSAANNPRDISIIEEYSSICGIKESELVRYFDDDINDFSEKLKVSKAEMYKKLKAKYDGYLFCENTDGIYNPFSLINALASKKLSNYWFATGTPTYLTLMLKKSNFDPSTLEGDIEASLETLSSFGNGESNIIAALYQSGYLTIKSAEDNFYTLGIPNEEVANGLTAYLIPEYSGTTIGEYDSEIRKLGKLIKAGDANGMMEQLQTIMEEIPFENNEPKMVEVHFRNMVYLMIRATGHKTYVEMPKLGGRIDISFETEQYAYIIECKRDSSAKEALSQINEKKYDKLSTTGKKTFKIGVNFNTEEKNITEWVIE